MEASYYLINNLFKHKFFPLISFFLLFLVLPDAKISAYNLKNQAEPPDTILVGSEIDYPPYCFINDQGEAAGFSVELFREAANEMGIEVKFKTGAWNKLKYDLVNRKIDALPLVGRTPEREELYDFTVPYLTMHGAIVVREDEDEINSVKDLTGKQVAVMKGDNSEEFLRRKELDAEIIQRTTFKRALIELSEGQHDAVVIQRLTALQLMKENGIRNLKIVGDPTGIFGQTFCFAVSEGDSKLLSLLNEGLSIVNENGTYRQLHTEWFASLESYKKTKQRIIIGGDHNYPPYEYLDKNGNPTGYSVELMKAIAEETGMNITFRLGPWSQIRKELKEGQIDAIQGMLYSPERDKSFDLTPAHTHITYVIVGRKNSELPQNLEELKGESVVVQESDLMHDRALEVGLKEELTPVETQEKALENLHNGKYDYAITSRALTNYYKDKHGWENLTMTRETIHSADYCIAVGEGNTALLSKFTEGLSAIKASRKYHDIYADWLGIYEEPDYTFNDFLKHAVYVLIPLILILILSLIWSRTLKQQVRKRTRELKNEISERKKFEKGLKAKEKKYRDLFTSIRDAILVVDNDRNIVDCNPAFTDLFGYKLEEIKGESTKRIFHNSEEYEELGESLDKVKEKTKDFLKTIQYKRKDGSVFPGEVNVFDLEDENGNTTGFIGLIRDITERLKAEEALRQSKETAEKYLNIAAEIILSMDTEGNITLLNDSGHQLLGYEKGELIGKNWLNTCVPKDEQERVREIFRDLIDQNSDDKKVAENTVVTKKGEIKTILWHNSVLRNNNGEITGILTSGEDITERKKIERQLRELNERLQAQNEYLGEINKELEKARKEAEESDRLKSAFLANMSHEIRTPMNGILGFADLLKNPQLTGTKKMQFIDIIRKSGERMLEIINNLLDIAKIEADQTEVEYSTTSVNDLLDELAVFFRPEAERKNLELKHKTALSSSDALIVTDTTKLNQILSNLIKNAIKYTKEGEIEFGYTLEKDMLQFYVSDTGIGISPELQEKMFDRFRQAELDVSREYEGAGLGLSISKAYVEKLGGKIWLKSTLDKGSTFYFTIPYKRPSSKENKTRETSEEKLEGLPGNLTILVTEDDETSYMLIEEIINDKNITLLRAKNGREAIEQVRNKPSIDLVLMDIKMPDMNGYEATKKIKDLRPKLPVIAQTAFASKEDRQKAIEAGCSEYFSKPISSNELKNAIKKFIQ
ncbi:MAG: transporter substrate-binding domain-containing protein [Bacteroidota bacterium]